MSNCVSGGLWPIACPGIVGFVETGERIEIDTDTAEIRNLDTAARRVARRFRSCTGTWPRPAERSLT